MKSGKNLEWNSGDSGDSGDSDDSDNSDDSEDIWQESSKNLARICRLW